MRGCMENFIRLSFQNANPDIKDSSLLIFGVFTRLNIERNIMKLQEILQILPKQYKKLK
jgi:hypothetical protein